MRALAAILALALASALAAAPALAQAPSPGGPSSAQDAADADDPAAAEPAARDGASAAVHLRVLPVARTGPFARAGAWTWLAVEVENKGAAPLEGVLRASRGNGPRPSQRAPTAFERPVSLPPRGKRVERLLYFVREENGKAVVGFFARGESEEPLAWAVVDVRQTHGVNALAVSRDDSAFGLFAGTAMGGMRRDEVEVASLSVEELPERPEAYGAIDAVALCGADLRALTPGQGEALEGFVEQGGQLLLAFGGNAAEWRDTPLEALLPVDLPEGVRSCTLTAFTALACAPEGEIPDEVPCAVARARPGADVLLRAADGAALVARRRIGAGHVTFLAIDPTRRPVRGTATMRGLVEALLGAAPERPLDDDFPDRFTLDPLERKLQALATTAGSVRTPPFAVMGLVLAVYVVLAVPVNYAFWRRRGRAERAAPTAVALAIAASWLVFSIGQGYRGGVNAATEVTLLDGAEGDTRGRLTAWCGAFSSERRIGRADARAPAAPPPPLDGQIEERERRLSAGVHVDAGPRGGRRYSVEPFELDQSAWRYLALRGPGDVPVVRASLALSEARITGTIEAPRDVALRDAFVIVGRCFAAVGDIEAGKTKSLRASLAKGLATAPRLELGAAAEGQSLAIDRAALVSLAARRPHLPPGEGALEGLLVAAADPDDEPLLGFDFAPPLRRAARVVAIAVPISLAEGGVELPPGVLRPRVTLELGSQVTREMGGFMGNRFRADRGDDETLLHFDKGRLELAFFLPCHDRLSVTQLDLDLRGAEDAPNLEVEVRGRGTKKLLRMNGWSATITSPASFVDPDTGALRVVIRETEEREPFVFREPELKVRGRLRR